MNTLKRKLTAILLTFAMLFSLMPALPQTAEAKSGDHTASNNYVTMKYGYGSANKQITVNVYIEGQEGIVDTLQITDGASTNNDITISLNEGVDYEFAGRDGVTVDWDDTDGSYSEEDMTRDLKTFTCHLETGIADKYVFSITLRTPQERADVGESGAYEGTSEIDFRAYPVQLLKMLQLALPDMDVTTETTIDGVTINFIESYAGSQYQYDMTSINREKDYFNIPFSNVSGKATPDNVDSIVITYNGDNSVKIPSSALRFNWHEGLGVENYYSIESNNDEIRTVCFFNSDDYASSTNFNSLYAIEFVDDSKCLGDKMPSDPVYDGVDYKFVNWEIESFDGTGEAFLPTTIIDKDMNVFAHKVSSTYAGGTEIRIMNNYRDGENQLLSKLAEEVGTTIDQIDKDSIKIRVYGNNGEYTDEDYSVNDWNSLGNGNDYYHVSNAVASVVVGPGHNTHVGFDQVSSITVYFFLNGNDTMQTVAIPVGNEAGELAKMMKGLAGDLILQLYIIQPSDVFDDGTEDPEIQPPTHDQLEDLINVSVSCSTDGHDSQTTGLLPNTNNENDSYTLDVTGTTATVTVHNAPYVTWYAGKYNNIQHNIAEGSAPDQTVTLEYDSTNGWQLAAEQVATVAFSVVCSGGSVTPDPGVDITGFEKDLITEDEYAAIDNTTWQEGFDVKGVKLPVKGETVVIPYESNVTLLYSITVSGAGDKQFKVIDNGATLVGSTDASVEQSGDTFTGTLPKNGGSVTFYVTKTFNDVEEIDNKTYVANRASIEGNVADDVDKDVTEAVEAEKATKPEDPTYEDMKEPVVNGAVKIDCINPLVQHEDPTYGLIEGSYTLPENGVVGDEANGFTYTITVSPDKYVETYNTNTHSSHTLVDGQSAKTITYKYDNGDWVVADTTALPLVYEVNCDATPDQYINGFDKELVSTAEAAEAAVGTSEGYAFPNKQEIVLVPNGGEVTLLYSITVEGKPGTAFVIEDQGAELVKGDVDNTRGDNLFYGHLPAGEESLTFYVAKTFKAADITDGKLTNHAKIEIDKEDGEEGAIDPDVNPDVDEVVDAEEEPALPTEEWLKENFDVELDCKSNVGHENQTYDLVYKDGMLGALTRDDEGNYTITMTVAGTDYLAQFNEASENVAHQVVGDATKTITLTYNKESNDWTADSFLIKFDVKCSGTGNYDINGIAKDLVAGDDDKTAAQNNGVKNLDSFTIPEAGETVIIPAGESVTLLYSITVTGNAEEAVDFVVTDRDTTLVPSSAAVTQKDDGTYTGTIPKGGSVTFYVSKEFTGANINKDGELVNTASVDGADDETTVDPDDDVSETVDAEEAISVTPADITIYMGGEQGYEAVVGTDGEILGKDNNSLPEPGFTVTLPEKLKGTDVTELTFKEKDGTRTWHFETYDGQKGTDVYRLVPDGEEQTATRVIFTDKEDGHTIVSDEFTVGLEVNTSFDMALYKGSDETAVGDIETTIGEKTYAVDSDNIGELTVRGTTEDIRFADANANAESTADPELDVDDNTTFTINDSNVRVTDEEGIALLFDEVINNNGEDRTGLLEDKADEVLNVDADEMSYDFKYLDLVDTHNGNTWVKASDDVTIYWPLPEGTDADTDFTLLHFKDLHREMQSEEEIQQQIENCDVETDATTGTSIEIVEVTDEYVVMKTGETGFSPFALAWETDNGGSDTPGGDTPGGNDPWYPPYNPGDDDKPSGLNTEDHFSYVVGYEDGMVKPQRSITRAEVATIFYRLLEDDVRDDYDTTRNNFSDVTSDSWYNQTVSTLASMGILKGYEDGTFRPNASITRAEFAAIATRFFEETGATYEPGTFTDVTGSEWFAGAIMDAVNLGLIGGYEDGTVRPNNNITRAEACAIVNRTLGRVPDADHLLPADEMTTWPDNPSSAWFYADMQEATNGHEYEWITEDGNKIEEWTDILDKDWNDR